MQASSKSVPCPTCGLPATSTLSERIGPVRDHEGHALALSCQSNHDRPDEPALLKTLVPGTTRGPAVDGQLGHLVNPELTLSEELQDGPEGCLSLPDLTFDCKRALSVVATGFNMHGDPVRIEGSDLLARAVQHETDHLDGVLFIDRLDREARKAAMKAIRESDWFGPAPTIKASPHPTRGLAL